MQQPLKLSIIAIYRARHKSQVCVNLSMKTVSRYKLLSKYSS